MTPSSLLMAFLALALVLGLIWLAQKAAQRGLAPLLRTQGQEGGRLGRVATLALDPRRRLHLLSCEGRVVLLLTGGPQDLVVGWLPDAGDATRPEHRP